MKNLILLSLLLPAFLLCLSCSTKPAVSGDTFGTGVSNRDQAVAVSDVVHKLESNDSVKVVMKAKVTEVCQAKGCWMNLVDATAPSDQKFMVKFKDYAFFMPKDLAGKEVLVEGTAYKELTPVSELRHYAEDAGKSKKEINKIKGPEKQIVFQAQGLKVI